MKQKSIFFSPAQLFRFFNYLNCAYCNCYATKKAIRHCLAKWFYAINDNIVAEWNETFGGQKFISELFNVYRY